MPRLRVSAISFLNTAPLMWDFDYGPLRQQYRVDYTLPSQCAEFLRLGAADIGIIPVAAYATIPDLVIIPDVAIAARGPVRSIFLISKVPVEQVRSVATDTSSRTSVALLRVLFEKKWKTKPEFLAREPKLKMMLKECDAALLIGDSALVAEKDGHYVYDLAEEWERLTNLPFVFAFWAVRKAALTSDIDPAKVVYDFQLSRDRGLQPENIARLAGEWANRIALSDPQIVSYLTEAIHYGLDGECLQGLELFFEYAAQCGALPMAPVVEFLDAKAASGAISR
jgi:chorismate dehydratase